jgi:succinoglycan biosynthesis transport protein ExoP
MAGRISSVPAGDQSDLDLRTYLNLLWRRKRLIVLVVLVFVNVTLILSLRQEMVYASEARVLLTPEVFGSRANVVLDPALAVQTEIGIFQSEPVRALVTERLGVDAKASAERAGQTLLIKVIAESPRPEQAALIANTYARAYIELRGRIGADPAEGQAVGENVDTPYSAESTAVPKLLSEAEVPTEPVRPKPVRNAVLAGVLGLLVGVGLASALDLLNDSVKTREELAARSGLPVLAVIPAFGGEALVDPAAKSRESESFRSLRTSLQLLAVDHPISTVQLTSAGSGEGKTTMLANLGMAIAGTGQTVLIMDCDLRRSELHNVFGLANGVGVTSVLSGEVPLRSAVQPVPQSPNIHLLAAGPLPPNPSELLASRKMADLVATLAEQFDVVLVDSPPVLAVTDAIVITTWVDATVVVCCENKTRRKHLRGALEQLRQANAPLVGAILNLSVPDRDDAAYALYYVSPVPVAHEALDPPPLVPGGRRRAAPDEGVSRNGRSDDGDHPAEDDDVPEVRKTLG